jgi:hypothetical protein
LAPPPPQQDAQCNNYFRSIPDRFLKGRSAQDSPQGQYLVPGLNFSCNGFITGLTFAARVPEDRQKEKQMYFQIWRPTRAQEYSLATEVVVSTSIQRRMRDRTLITHSLSSPIAVSSGDAIGYSIVAAPTALQIARASVTPDELEGVIYTDGFQYDDEDDLEDEGDSQGSGNGARYIFINLARTNSDEDIQILSTAMFSPLITVTMRETPGVCTCVHRLNTRVYGGWVSACVRVRIVWRGRVRIGSVTPDYACVRV